MAHANIMIAIDDNVLKDIYPDLVNLEVELDDDLTAMFRLRIVLALQPDGSWNYLDDGTFAVWKPVSISAGFGDEMEELIAGYITHLKPSFECDPTRCVLEVWGMDGSVLMDREEKLKDWPNKKDSDIAAEILELYAFTPEVEDTQVIHNEEVSTIIQRETDMQFLRRLALRNGYECYIEGTTGYFRPPQIDASPQPVLAAHFGAETSIKSFSIEVNALSPSNIAMFQVDRTNKEVLEAVAESSQQTALGSTGPDALPGRGIQPAKSFISMNVTVNNAEMLALCQGLYHQAEWFVSGEGEINANSYGYILRARRPVTIKGIGETYSGVYYVTHVTHSFTRDGYSQHFRVKRNGIGLTGDEKFSTSSGGLL